MKTRLSLRTISIIFGAYLWLLMNPVTVQAQDCSHHFEPTTIPFATTESRLPETMSRQIEESLQSDMGQLEKPYLDDKKTAYQERSQYLQNLLYNDYFLFSDSLQSEIDYLGDRLLKANDIDRSERIRFMLSRSGVPNASCRGEGTIVLNLGLLARLDNTEQLAFVMAHELAHHHFNHVNQSIHERITFLNSETTNKKIEKAKRGEALANSELLAWLKDRLVDYSRHSRTHEMETDALGIQYYLKANFNAAEALSALQALGEMDHPLKPLPDLQHYFDFPEYPWRAEWAVSYLSGLSLVKPSEEERELLRTHPDLEQRIAQAKRLLPASERANKNDLCTWKPQLNLEILERDYEVRNFFGALRNALHLLGTEQKNSYANGIVAHCLLDLCKVRKQHQFGKYVPSPNSKMRDDDFALATFLDNLSYSNLKNISRQWTQQKMPQLPAEEMVAALKIKLEWLEQDFAEDLKPTNAFTQKWPNSIYFK